MTSISSRRLLAQRKILQEMSWSLENSEEGVYLNINERRAINLNDGKEFGVIDSIASGRNATEVWVSKE